MKTRSRRARPEGDAPAFSFPMPAANRGLSVLALAAAVAAGIGQAGAARAQQPAASAVAARQVALPAQPLAATLGALSRLFGTSIGADAALLVGKSSPALNGEMTLEQALRRALAGSGLATARSGASALTVVPAPASEVGVLPALVVEADREVPGARPAAYAGGQVARGGGLGLLGDTDFMDAPFSTASYTEKTIQDQQPRTIADFLARNDASVRVVGGEGDSTDTLRIRGFDLASDEVAFNGLPGLLAQYRSSAEFVDRVEVLKGPGAMLSGMSPSGAVGGAINVLPKRAADEPLSRVTASYFSDTRVGLHADVGRRFGEDNRFGLRVNGALRRGDTPRDHQHEQLGVATVALDYRGERLRVGLDYLAQSNRGRSARTALSNFAALPGVALAPPSGETNFSQPWATLRNGDRTLAARLEYDLSDEVTAYAAIGRSKGWHEGVDGNITVVSPNGDTTQTLSATAFDMRTTSAEAGLRGRLRTGPVSHRWALAANTLKRDVGWAFGAPIETVASNIYDPVIVPRPAVLSSVSAAPASQSRLRSVGFADTLGFAGDSVLLTVGARRQQVETQNFPAVEAPYDEAVTTPLAGLVVKPWDGVSLFANYVEGLSQGAVAPAGTANAGQVLAPFKTRQVEAGIKRDWGRVSTTASLFQIKKPSAFRDPVTDRYETGGEQRHRGLELNAFGEVARGVRLLGGLTWLDAEMTRTDSPATAGRRPVGVPRLTANLRGEWDVPAAQGLTLVAAAVYSGDAYADATNRTRVPGWTRFDFGARWNTRIMARNVVLRATVENAFDKRYWSIGTWGSGYLGLPRALVLSASMDF